MCLSLFVVVIVLILTREFFKKKFWPNMGFFSNDYFFGSLQSFFWSDTESTFFGSNALVSIFCHDTEVFFGTLTSFFGSDTDTEASLKIENV